MEKNSEIVDQPDSSGILFYHEKQVHLSFPEALKRVKELIANSGFGILSEISMSDKFKEKLGKSIDPYTILGICHPQSAYRAVQAEQHIGLMLPCNLIVYVKDNSTFVASIRPTVFMSSLGKPELTAVAKEVEEKLKEIVDLTTSG